MLLLHPRATSGAGAHCTSVLSPCQVPAGRGPTASGRGTGSLPLRGRLGLGAAARDGQKDLGWKPDPATCVGGPRSLTCGTGTRPPGVACRWLPARGLTQAHLPSRVAASPPLCSQVPRCTASREHWTCSPHPLQDSGCQQSQLAPGRGREGKDVPAQSTCSAPVAEGAPWRAGSTRG